MAELDLLYDNTVSDEGETDVDTEQHADTEGDTNVDAEQPLQETEETEVLEEAEDGAELAIPDKKFQFNEETKKYVFKSDGKEVEADVSQLIDRYQVVENFAKIKTEFADKEAARSTEHTQVLANLKAQEEKVTSLANELTAILNEQEQAVDWEELRQFDTAEYLKQKELHQKRKDTLAEATATVAKQQKEIARQRLHAEFKKLTEAHPEWATDEKARTRDLSKIDKGLNFIGFANEEIPQLADSRAYEAGLLIAELLELREKAKSVQKEVKAAPKSVKPQKSVKREQPKSYAEALYGPD